LNAGPDLEKVRTNALAAKVNFRYIDNATFSISLDETTGEEELNTIFSVLTKSKNSTLKNLSAVHHHISRLHFNEQVHI
jgi:hypothetical protein